MTPKDTYVKKLMHAVDILGRSYQHNMDLARSLREEFGCEETPWVASVRQLVVDLCDDAVAELNNLQDHPTPQHEYTSVAYRRAREYLDLSIKKLESNE